jgi:hypothetical protein
MKTITKVLVVFLISVFCTVGIGLVFADSTSKCQRPDGDTIQADSGCIINMKSGSTIKSNGSLPTPFARVAVPTPNPTPVGTVIWGEVNILQNRVNSLMQALENVGILATPSPTPTPTP